MLKWHIYFKVFMIIRYSRRFSLMKTFCLAEIIWLKTDKLRLHKNIVFKGILSS